MMSAKSNQEPLRCPPLGIRQQLHDGRHHQVRGLGRLNVHAVNRVDPHDRDAEPFLPHERISLTSALRAFTQGSAWAHRLDVETGILEPGRLADIVVLDRDVYDRGTGPIGDARVRLTMVEGEPVHDPDRLLS